MAEEWEKFLQKQPLATRQRIIDVVQKIIDTAWDELDIIKLKGESNTYRCRVGKFRIVFERKQDASILIKRIGSRGDVY